MFDPAAGIYQLKQTIELPSIPIGLTWADFMRVVTEMQQRAAALAGNFDPNAASGSARGTRAVVAGPAPFGCPTNCPPPTVGLPCQPHPDRTAFANRVIFKFTSIPEPVLNAEPPSGLGIRRDRMTALGSSPDAIAATASARLVNWLEEHLPVPGEGLDLGKAAFLAQQQQAALAGLRTVSQTVIAAAVRASPEAYEA